MESPRCDECNKLLEDWSGNIMVNSTEYPDKVNYLMIWCKQCTIDLDRKGVGGDYHNLWELSWVKQAYFDLEKELFTEILSGHKNWSIDAINRFNNLGRSLYEKEES